MIGVFFVPLIQLHLDRKPYLSLRFSDIGDMIISTAADKDELARLVLSNGRKFTGFVTDPANKNALEELLSEAVSDAMMRGPHAHLRGRSKGVTVGGGTLPASVPADNISTARREKLGKALDGGDSDTEADVAAAAERHLFLARQDADDYDLEIKVNFSCCSCCTSSYNERACQVRYFPKRIECSSARAWLCS